MGSDRAMERVHIKTEGEWVQQDETQYLRIVRSSSEDGYKEKNVIWTGFPNEDNESLIKLLIGTIPERPALVFSPYRTIERVLYRVTKVKGSWSTADANEIWQAFVDAGFEGKP